MRKQRFDDLSDAEVLALTEEQVDRWIDIECAHEGAAMVGPMPEAPVDNTPKEDAELYEVGGFLFTDRSEADAVAEVVREARSRVGLVHTSDWRHQVVGEAPDVDVSKTRKFTAATWSTVADAKMAAERAKNIYDADLRRWRERAEARSSISRAICSRVSEVHDEERQRAVMRERLTHYVDLADGNREMAVTFLVKAYPDAERLLGSDFLYPAEEMTAADL